MPVEIRELVIRAVVDSPAADQASQARQQQLEQPALDAIVEECVRQVLQALKKSGER